MGLFFVSKLDVGNSWEMSCMVSREISNANQLTNFFVG